MLNKLFWVLRAFLYKPFFKKIGMISYIGPPIFLKGINKISLGSKVRIFPLSRMEVHGSDGEIVIEDNVGIGQNLHITAMGSLVIGSGTTISSNVLITDIDHEYRKIGVSILDQEYIYSKTKIGENCFIGSGSTLQAGTILGKQCIVGAGAVVRGEFPDFCVIVGVPGKVVKRFNPETQKWEKTNADGSFFNSKTFD